MDKRLTKYVYQDEQREASKSLDEGAERHFVIKAPDASPVDDPPSTSSLVKHLFGMMRRAKVVPSNDATEPLLPGAANDAKTAADDAKTTREIEERQLARVRTAAGKANLLLMNDAESAHRRKMYALAFVVLACGLVVPWAMARWVVTPDAVDAWWKNSLLSLGVLSAMLVVTVVLPYMFPRLLKSRSYAVQVAYMLVSMTLMTGMLACYVVLVQDPFVNVIILYAACFLGGMAIYCIVPVGRFHHGAAGLFAILVFSAAIFVIVVYPNYDFTRDYISHRLSSMPASIDELEALRPPEQMILDTVQLVGTLALMLFVLYRMHITSEMTYAHDPLFLALQVYVIIIPSLLFFLAPKSMLPGVSWRK
jgi:hypothetical protein